MLDATGVEKGKITVNKIVWRVPHYSVSDSEKLKLMDIIEKNVPLSISHRQWELFTYPVLPQNHNFTWVLKSSSFLERPRFIIFGMQTDRRNNFKKDATKFDHCNLRNLKLFLNSQSYPYENMNLNFRKEQFAVAYDMYVKFQTSYYYNKKILCELPLTYSNLLHH